MTSGRAKLSANGTGEVDWGAALATHGRWLRTVVLGRLEDVHAVDEVMQEVALAAVSDRASPDPARVPAWLYRVALRQVQLYQRRHGRRRRVDGLAGREAAPAAMSGVEGDPLRWLLSDERTRLVREALTRLGRRDRELLLLKYTEGWSYREMADHLGATPGAIDARLVRARRRLRHELEHPPAKEDRP